ncbi:MAG: type IV pilus assembly protein PilM [bacterium]
MIFGKPSAFGLDLSDLSLKLVWLKNDGRHIELAGFGRFDIPETVIEEGTIKKEKELIEIIKKSLAETKGDKINTPYCVVSLPERESYIRIVHLPKMKEGEIGEAIKWELESNIPVSLGDLYFDWQMIGASMDSKDQLDILIGALPKILVDPYLDVIKKTGLKPIAFEIESVATARALIKEGSVSEPLMIVDLGARRSSFVVFADNTVWLTTSVPVSNNLLVDDISKALKVTYAKAKKMKFEIGLDLSEEDGKVFGAMEPRLLELVGEIKKYMDYYQTTSLAKQSGKALISKILLCGGGANLKGLSVFLSSHLKIEVSVGNPWIDIIEAGSNELPELSFPDSLSYTTAIGLALRGLEYI